MAHDFAVTAHWAGPFEERGLEVWAQGLRGQLQQPRQGTVERQLQVRGLRAVIQFDLSGEGGGQWFVTIADRTLNVQTGQSPAPTLTLTSTTTRALFNFHGLAFPRPLLCQSLLLSPNSIALGSSLLFELLGVVEIGKPVLSTSIVLLGKRFRHVQLPLARSFE